MSLLRKSLGFWRVKESSHVLVGKSNIHDSRHIPCQENPEDSKPKYGKLNCSEDTESFLPIKFPHDSRPVFIHQPWLRHHCRCANCFNLLTHQRKTVPSLALLNSKISNIEIDQDRNTIHVEWVDTHKSIFPIGWLLSNSPKQNPLHLIPSSKELHFKPKFLTDYHSCEQHEHDFQTKTPNPLEYGIYYKNFMYDDNYVRQLLQNIADSGFGVVTGVPWDNITETQNVHHRISHPIRTLYGDGVTVATSDLKHSDTAYTSEALSLHNDTTYFTEQMGLQSFHVLHHAGSGGINCFADGYQVAQKLYNENSLFYKTLATIPLPSEYYEPGYHHYKSIDTTFTHDLSTGHLEKIRFNPLDLGTITNIDPAQLTLFYQSYLRYAELLNRNSIWIKLEPGMILFIDNWRILHGRSSFTGERKLASAYFPRSDWKSRGRILGLEM